ncbi:MAG: hypothetical protein ACI8UX_002361, partial [Psychromonas sp.]
MNRDLKFYDEPDLLALTRYENIINSFCWAS